VSGDPANAIWNTFFEECEEQLGELEGGLLRLQDGTAEPDCLNAVFRAVHSIKGGAGIFALNPLIRFAHVFETTLSVVRDGKLEMTPDVMTIFIRAADVLADLVRAARDKAPDDPSKTKGIAAQLAALNDGVGAGKKPAVDAVMAPKKPAAKAPPPPPPAEPDHVWHIQFTPTPASDATSHEVALLLHELGRLGPMTVVGGPDAAMNHIEGAIEVSPGQLWHIVVRANCDEAALREIFSFADEEWKLRISMGALDEAGDAPAAMEAAPEPEPEPEPEFQGFEIFAPDPEPEPEPEPEPMKVTAEMPPPKPEKLAPTVSADPVVAETGAKAAAVSKTIRVDLDRVDRMIDLVGELVINGSMLGQMLGEAGISRAAGVALALRDLEQLTREIQDSVMAIRAQPVRAVFQRMTRLVREVSAQTGKPARLITEGDNTELDQTVIERIGEPLTHLIRNAVDHGLEDAEGRRAAGKPLEGAIRLRALHRSGRIIMEVGDDGKGLDRARIKQKAVQKGLIPAEAQLTDPEIDELIFLPGFSTAQVISDVSGRGVGMDVVRRSVQALGGRISITSKPGEGSSFIMSLPLTLAVLDGMVVAAAEQILIVPLTTIIETLKPRAANVHELDGTMQMLALRGNFVPLVDVSLALGFSNKPAEAAQSVALLVETERGVRAALLVDRIIEQRQVVIKSLESNYQAVNCIAAATVLGDGRVALILDVDAIIPAGKPEQLMSRIGSYEDEWA
jgi:two-component system chemotaxis sensor kinase CheA